MADNIKGHSTKRVEALKTEVKSIFRGPSTEKATLSIGAATDKGMKSWNEDALGVWQSGKKGALLVADGIGGMVAGDDASWLARESAEKRLKKLLSTGGVLERAGVDGELGAIFSDALQKIREHSKTNLHGAATGSTMTIIVADLEASMAYGAHIGDSKAYLIRQFEITQLTNEHKADGQGHVLTKALLSEEAQKQVTTPDILVPIRLARGDMLVVCSDGLNANLTRDEIRDGFVKNESDPQKGCDAVIKLATSRIARDHVSVAAIRIG